MPSYQITITPSRRAAVRYIERVRRTFLRAFSTEAAATGLTQTEIASRLGVNRSVVHRELRGDANLTQGRVGELAWAMGYEPVFELRKIDRNQGANDQNNGGVTLNNTLVNVPATSSTLKNAPVRFSTTTATSEPTLKYSVQS